jgi:Zn-dependent protease
MSTVVREEPKLVAGVERRRCGDDTVVARRDGRRHLFLCDNDLAVLDACDGTMSADAIVARFGTSAAELLDELADGGFLDGTPTAATPRVVVSSTGVEFADFDRFVGALMRAGGRFVVTVAGGVLAVTIGVVGLVLLAASWGWPHTDLSAQGAVVAIWCLVASGIPAGILHETAHALVIDRHGRRVGAAGFGFYWGQLSFFVDATDALMLPRRHRMSQALAGPCSDLVVGGVLASVAWLSGPTDTGLLLRLVAVLMYLNVLINLVPLLQLDGYWFLADALDEPQLRQKSLRALCHPRSATGRRQRGLVLYAAASIVFGVLLLVSGAAVWLSELLPIATTAFHTSLLGAIGAVIFFAPLTLGIAAQALHLVATTGAIPTRMGGEQT